MGEEFTRYFNPCLRGTMVLTDKKKWLGRYFSRLPRESLCTGLVMLFTTFQLALTGPTVTMKVTLSA